MSYGEKALVYVCLFVALTPVNVEVDTIAWVCAAICLGYAGVNLFRDFKG